MLDAKLCGVQKNSEFSTMESVLFGFYSEDHGMKMVKAVIEGFQRSVVWRGTVRGEHRETIFRPLKVYDMSRYCDIVEKETECWGYEMLRPSCFRKNLTAVEMCEAMTTCSHYIAYKERGHPAFRVGVFEFNAKRQRVDEEVELTAKSRPAEDNAARVDCK